MCGTLLRDYFDQYSLVVSEPVVREIIEVLHRPELVRKFRALTSIDARRVIDLLGEAEAVDLGEVPSISREPNDDKFLATAAAAQADYLVTEDKDLLVLGVHGGTRILDVASFLEILKSAQL